MSAVRLFGKLGCAECAACKAALDKNGVAYRYFDVESVEGMTELSDAGWSDKLPVLIAGDKRAEGPAWRLLAVVL